MASRKSFNVSVPQGQPGYDEVAASPFIGDQREDGGDEPSISSSSDQEDSSSDEEKDIQKMVRCQRLPKRCTLRVCLFSCCLGFAVCLVLTMVALLLVGRQLVNLAANRQNVQDRHITPVQFPRYNSCGGCKPGYKSDKELEACTHPCFTLRYVLDWERLAEEAGFKLVFFPSRPGPQGEKPINISAWWLPPPASARDPATAPRVVALHGLASNNNHCGVQASCFLLRQLGYGCLAPSVRDYGFSGPSSHPHTMTWGYDYHLDLLGAWDYAVNDPDGELGGALSDEKVAIMGFSKGALGAANAFAVEPRIPGAWFDSGPYCGLHGMIANSIKRYLGILTPLVTEVVWWGANLASETPIDYYHPLEMLAKCSGPARYVAISQGMFDNVVPVEEGRRAAFLLGGLPECYKLRTYTPPEYCNGATHHQEMWEFADETRTVMCHFFREVFGEPFLPCPPSLPSYQVWQSPSHLPRDTPPISNAFE